MRVLDDLKREWRNFRHDEPGVRFVHYHQRVKMRGGIGRVVRLVLGLVLVAGGGVMLVVPGPGLLTILFGLAMFSGESRPLARLLDRLEVWARAAWRRMKHRLALRGRFGRRGSPGGRPGKRPSPPPEVVPDHGDDVAADHTRATGAQTRRLERETP